MLSSLFEKDRISQFAKGIAPGVLPKIGIGPIDDLMEFPAQNLPNKADLSQYPEELHTLCASLSKLSNSDAGLGMAAMLIMTAKSWPMTRAMDLLWNLRGGAATWSPKTAIAMMLSFPDRENGPTDSYTGKILEKSFPSGLPKRVQAALETFLDNLKAPDHGLSQYQKNQIEDLEILAGRDPQKNPVIVAQAQKVSDYLRLQSEILPLFGPLMRPVIDRLRNGENTGYQFSLDWDEEVAGYSAQQRGEFILEVIRFFALKQHPGYSAAVIWECRSDALRLQDIMIPRSWNTGDIKRKSATFSEEQAKEIIQRSIVFWRGRWEFQLADSPMPLLTALATAIESPDEELAGQIRSLTTNKALLQPLLNKLCPIEAAQGQRTYTGTKVERDMARTLDDLSFALKRVPGMWVTVLSEHDGYWGMIDHQIFPYCSEVNRYLSAVAAAARIGGNVEAHLKKIDDLIERVGNNLLLLKDGRFEARSYTDIAAGFPKGEEQSPKNIYWTIRAPESQKEVFDASGKPKIKLILDIEARKFRSIVEEREKIESLLPKDDLARAIFNLLPDQKTAKPSKAWIKRADDLLDPNLLQQILDKIRAYDAPGRMLELPLEDIIDFDKSAQWAANERQMQIMLWAAHLVGPDVAPLLFDFAQRSYEKIPGVGIRREKLGNAASISLSLLEGGAGAPYLMRLQRKITYSGVKKRITKYLEDAAALAGMSRRDLEELSTTNHELADGRRRIPLSEGAAILEVTSGKVALGWEDGSGKERKTLPKGVKEADPAGIKQVRALVKEIESDLATWKDRLEVTFLQDVSWDYDIWRARYADHGTLAVLARRLIWNIERDGNAMTVLPVAEGCVDVNGQPVDCSNAKVSLWHPLDSDPAVVAAWRTSLIELEIQQPFRQAWRETFSLTDAERDTHIYSNRFAGHVLRQHQMMALGAANGWQSTHRTGFDSPDDEPSHIRVSDFGLQAEYWTSMLAPDSPTTDSGSYLYIATDRVKFHKLDSKARFGRGDEQPLEEIPPRIFSEILRHCDLFTSVSSISLDPEWEDRGRDAEHPSQWRRDADIYWATSHTRRLEGSAKTRREMLEILLPRLKKAKYFSLDDMHLKVQGKKHAYLIHLGSAAVHLEANRRHVCIVPDAKPKKIALPFEGDATLSTILSKAFLLVDDDKITDTVILNQI